MPERKRESVIINTGPIIALSLLGQFDLLEKLYQNIYTPEAVVQEIVVGGTDAPGYDEVAKSSWLVKKKLDNPIPPLLSMVLDIGEAETIALALEMNIRRVVIDESLGREVADHLGLLPTGTIGILLKAKRNGYIPEIRPLLDVLMENGFWLKQQLYDWALAEAGE